MKVEDILSEIKAATRPCAERPTLETRRMGWGSLKNGTSVGGQPLMLGDAVFEHGWGDHAQSRHIARLPSPATRFEAYVGVQGHTGFRSRLVFSVYAPDGRLLARSPELGTGDAPFLLSADLAGLKAFAFGVVDVRVDEDFEGTPPVANANWCDPAITLADGRRLLADDFAPEVTEIPHIAGFDFDANVHIEPRNGRACGGASPYFNIDCGNCGYILALGWPGQWQLDCAGTRTNTAHLSAGQKFFNSVLRPVKI